MEQADMAYLHNGQAQPFSDIPELSNADFHALVCTKVNQGTRIASYFGLPDTDTDSVTLLIVLANDTQGNLEIYRTSVTDAFPSLTPEVPQAHWFEREIHEQWDILPQGHPWLKPIRFHSPYRKQSNDIPEQVMGESTFNRSYASQPEIIPGVTDYFRAEGEEIHEVAVGPVHAGIIEPGHFRFQCHGENVLHLEIELGYQHRGIEQVLAKGLNNRTSHYMETLSGDTTIGHSTAYAMNIEALTGFVPSYQNQVVRAIALELERLANHTGDLGALAGDVGFLPTASYCGRLRGDFLNLTALLCGNRFGRNLIIPGGIRQDITEAVSKSLAERLPQIFGEVSEAVNLLWESSAVMTRFEGTGALNREDAIRLGLVGPAARACDLRRDVRCDYPAGAYMFLPSPAVTMQSGDVYARASIRWFEIQNSVQIIRTALPDMQSGAALPRLPDLAPDQIAVSLVEGWRGEICHVAITDEKGELKRYKVTDPSFHNWFGLAYALRNQQISDFPLCNKSFNLSYCGHDL